MAEIAAPDLTQRPPRSARVRLGGYVILPRMLDKGRATLAGRNGEYHYNCPLDQHWVKFAGVDPDALLAELKKGKGDGEMLDWITANSPRKPATHEILAWSDYQDRRGPTDLEQREFYFDYHAKLAPHRKDLVSWFDVLDLDDFVSYGGKA
jgi:hypothetical protein